MKCFVARAAFCAVACVTTIARAALLPPSFVSSVVAIGHNERTQDGSTRWVTDGSGFFYGFLAVNDPDPSKRLYHLYVMTNRHVIEGRSVISVRLNPKKVSEQGQVFDIPLVTNTGTRQWFTHADERVDVAGVQVSPKYLNERGIDFSFFANDQHAADVEKLKDIGVSAGDPIFVLGFPMNLAGEQRNYVIVRPGAIARVGDLIESAATVLLIDSHIFPGNSGGPVVLAPQMTAITGTKPSDRAYLVGMVRAYIPYRDVAISPQTGRPRVIFEENSGLAEVVPIHRLNEAIINWKRSQKPSETPVPTPGKTNL
jgi:S1-C subfamily serine protease